MGFKFPIFTFFLLPFSISILASGSKANALLLSTGHTSILIDAGLGIRTLLPALHSAGVRPEQLSAVCITHEHNDHVRGLTSLLSRARCPVYASAGTLDVIDYMIPVRCRAAALNHQTVSVGDLTVRGIPVPHDAAGPLAFCVEAGAHRITVATDLGEVPPELANALAHSTCAVLESNHDVAMLRAGPYPEILKQRILSATGHLSNAQTAAALAECRGNGLRHVVLAHLSDENNAPALAHAAAAAALDGEAVAVHITARSAAGPFLNLDQQSMS